jgi:polyphosphate kinase
MSTLEVEKMEMWIANNLDAFEKQKVRIAELKQQLEQCPRIQTAMYRGIKKQITVHQKLAVAYLQAAQNFQNTLKDL